MDPTPFTDPVYQDSHGQKLVSLRKASTFTDVMVKAGDVSLACHKVVLASSCHYLHDLLTDPINDKEVVLDDVEPALLETLLDFIYTASVNLTPENVWGLLGLCDKFSLNGLRERCLKYMGKDIVIDSSNCMELMKQSQKAGVSKYVPKLLKFLGANFNDLVQNFSESDYLAVSKDEVIEIVNKDDLNVANEDVVLEFVIRWAKADVQHRRPMFDEVLKYVRLPFCSSPVLTNTVEVLKEAGLDTEQCWQYMHEAIRYHTYPEQSHDIVTIRTNPRTMAQSRCLMLVGGIPNEGGDSQIIWYQTHYNPGCWKSEVLPGLEYVGVRTYAACLIPGGILITGGKKGETNLSDCRLLELSNMKWKPVPTLQVTRRRHASTSLAGTAYVIGGKTGEADEVTNTVEKLDSTGKEWVQVAPMLQKAYQLMSVVHLNRIFCLGGKTGKDSYVQTVQVYDPVWNEWTMKAEMPAVCQNGSAVVINDTIYTVGGFTRSCMAYDVKKNSWSTLRPPGLVHGSAPAVVWQGKILVVGGRIGYKQDRTCTAEEYDPTTDTWTVRENMLPMPLSSSFLLNVPYFYPEEKPGLPF